MHPPHRYQVMSDNCWDMEPDNRATFSQLKWTLHRFLADCQVRPPVDLEYEVQQQAKGKACICTSVTMVQFGQSFVMPTVLVLFADEVVTMLPHLLMHFLTSLPKAVTLSDMFSLL